MINTIHMHNTAPIPLSSSEWDEIASVPYVRESWGLHSDETGTSLAQSAYGTKFDYVSGSPGYCGDLYIVAGDALSAPPVMLIRRDGDLVPVTEF
jgi:hypothetical protein